MRLFDLHTHHLSENDDLTIRQLPLDQTTDFTTINIPFSYGIHPCQIKEGEIQKQLNQIQTACSSNQCILIGECGIDRFASAPLSLQEILFCQQLTIAKQYQKGGLIHCVKAFDRIVACVKQQQFDQQPLIFHGYRGKPQITKQLLNKRNCYFSFGEYFNKESLQLIPKERLFIESDTSTTPLREIYQHIAETRQITFIQLLEQININKKLLFPLL